MGRSLYAVLLLAIVVSVVTAGLVFEQQHSISAGLKETLEPVSLKNLIKAYVYVDGKEIADPPNLNVFWLLSDILGINHPLVTVDGLNITIGDISDTIKFINSNKKLDLRIGNSTVSTPPDKTFSPGSQGVAPDSCTYSYTDDTANNQFVVTITCYFNRVYNATEIWLQKQTDKGTFVFFYTKLASPILINQSYVTYKIYLKYAISGTSLKGLMDILEYFISGSSILGLPLTSYGHSSFDIIIGIGGDLTTSTSMVDTASYGTSKRAPCFSLYHSNMINDSAIFVTTGGSGGCGANTYNAIDLSIYYGIFSNAYTSVFYYSLSLVKIFTQVTYEGATDSYYLSLILRWG